MADIQTIVTPETIQNQIFTVRGKQVMLDRDLAKIYGVDTRIVNQAVKRNLERFPDDFMFELTRAEFASLRSQTVILEKKGGHSKYLPTVFSQEGIAMIASVLKSESAIAASGLLELSHYSNKVQAKKYQAFAEATLNSLSGPVYFAKEGNKHFLLRHSVGSIPHNMEVDVPLIYADYYYIEALLRYKHLPINRL